MKKYLLLGLCLLGACNQYTTDKEWKLVETLNLGEVKPIGITATKEGIWLSDGDRNRLVRIGETGKVTEVLSGLDRPMHIGSLQGNLYIPQYGNDQVMQLTAGRMSNLEIPLELDAPAGIHLYKDEIAIADFYNHRIVYYNGKEWTTFGKEGKGNGELYYPTDVQIDASRIWVADAYNNRVQVFDKNGNSLALLGQDEKINAATGLFVMKHQVFVTDFENDRVLVFSHDGDLIQVIREGIEKPTDVLFSEGRLYITNYRSAELKIYE